MQIRSDNEESIIYIDGNYLPEINAKISVFDHVVLYGDGVYDTCCAWNGKVFKLDEHIDRLYESAYSIKIQIPINKMDMKEAILETVRKNKHQNAYLKIIVTRGVGELPLLSPYNCKPTVIIFSKPYMRLVGEGGHEKGIRVKIAALRRIPDQCLYSKAKMINYQNHVLMRLEANEAGYDDAIELTIDGFVAEAPGYNVFVVKNGKLFTPPENILLGITRQTVFELAFEEGFQVLTERISPFDLFTADEVFFSSTAGGIFPVLSVDGRIVGSGKPGIITEKMRNGYNDLLESGEKSTPAFL